MITPDSYSAYWAPPLYNGEFDDDDVLAAAFKWLATSTHLGAPVVVMNAKKMVQNRPILGQAAQRFPFVSPQSGGPSGAGAMAVLAIWPVEKTLHYAEQLAHNGALCVIGGSLYDVSGWVARTHAVNLLRPSDEPPELAGVGLEVADTIRSICEFGGHNRFIGGDDKAEAIRDLRSMVAAGHRPDPALLEQHAIATGKTDGSGAARLRSYYEGILAGRTYRDYRGRTI